MNATHVTVWFDGACPLCLREIALMRRLDKRGAIAFIDATSEGAACPIDPALLLARFHAREGQGPLLHGAAAFAAMWRAIPLLRPLGKAARFPVQDGLRRAGRRHGAKPGTGLKTREALFNQGRHFRRIG